MNLDYYEFKRKRRETFRSIFEASVSDVNLNIANDCSPRFERNQYQPSNGMLCSVRSLQTNDCEPLDYEEMEPIELEKKFISELHINIQDPTMQQITASQVSQDDDAANFEPVFNDKPQLHCSKFETYINNKDLVGACKSPFIDLVEISDTATSTSDDDYTCCYDDNGSNCQNGFHAENDVANKPIDLSQICGDETNCDCYARYLEQNENRKTAHFVAQSVDESNRTMPTNEHCIDDDDCQSQNSFPSAQFSAKSVQTSIKCLLKECCDKGVGTDPYLYDTAKYIQNTKIYRRKKTQTSPIPGSDDSESLYRETNDYRERHRNHRKGRNGSSHKSKKRKSSQHKVLKFKYHNNDSNEECNEDTYAESYSDNYNEVNKKSKTKEKKLHKTKRSKSRNKNKNDDSFKSQLTDQKPKRKKRRNYDPSETNDDGTDSVFPECERRLTRNQATSETADSQLDNSYDIQRILDDLNARLTMTAQTRCPLPDFNSFSENEQPDSNMNDILNYNEASGRSFWDNPLENDILFRGLIKITKPENNEYIYNKNYDNKNDDNKNDDNKSNDNNNDDMYDNDKNDDDKYDDDKNDDDKNDDNKNDDNKNDDNKNQTGFRCKPRYYRDILDLIPKGSIIFQNKELLEKLKESRLNPEIQAIFDSIEMNQFNKDKQQPVVKPARKEPKKPQNDRSIRASQKKENYANPKLTLNETHKLPDILPNNNQNKNTKLNINTSLDATKITNRNTNKITNTNINTNKMTNANGNKNINNSGNKNINNGNKNINNNGNKNINNNGNKSTNANGNINRTTNAYKNTNSVSKPKTSNITTNNNRSQLQQSLINLNSKADDSLIKSMKYQRTFELSPYDELIKSYSNQSDRRIKSVASKNGCHITIDGPISHTDSGSTHQTGRTKVTYRCIIGSQAEHRLDKCLNYLRETFPNTCIRLNGRKGSNGK